MKCIIKFTKLFWILRVIRGRSNGRILPLVVVIAVLLCPPAFTHQSDNFKIEEHTFNAGGHPDDGIVMASASFRVTLDSMGDTVAGTSMTSASYSIDGGFAHSFPPPGEVQKLRFLDFETLEWDPERSIGDYGLYSGSVSGLVDSDYGVCDTAVPVETVIVDDDVPSGECQFYLVTARNRLGEEGTKGFRSPGGERPNDEPCP